MLGEWHRVLRPGGALRVHVPDSAALMHTYLDATNDEKWRVIGALLGMYANADVRGPTELEHSGDHQILFDRELLEGELRLAGFVSIADRTDDVLDAHSTGWRDVIPRISLVFEARKPE